MSLGEYFMQCGPGETALQRRIRPRMAEAYPLGGTCTAMRLDALDAAA
jgi:hypothetical protein